MISRRGAQPCLFNSLRKNRAPRLYENVEDVHVHGTPQILLPPLDPHEQFVQIPGVALATPAVLQPPRVVEPEPQTPLPNRLIRHSDTPFGEEILDISETQAEPAVEPDGATDENGGAKLDHSAAVGSA